VPNISFSLTKGVGNDLEAAALLDEQATVLNRRGGAIGLRAEDHDPVFAGNRYRHFFIFAICRDWSRPAPLAERRYLNAAWIG